MAVITIAGQQLYTIVKDKYRWKKNNICTEQQQETAIIEGTGGLEKHWHCNKQKEGSNIVTEYISHRIMKKTEKKAKVVAAFMGGRIYPIP